ncbi:MAG: D-Ala-D-Ala carboxypeptidase family metallohydrolase [Paracoccaceae bacterium]
MADLILTQAMLDELLAAIAALDAPVAVKKAHRKKLLDLWREAGAARTVAAQKKLRENTTRFLELMRAVEDELEELDGRSGPLSSDNVDQLRTELGELHREFHESAGLAKTFSSGDGLLEVMNDEVVTPSAADPVALPAATPPLETPEPIDSTAYPVLADEYVRYFLGAQIRTAHEGKAVELMRVAIRNRDRYAAVEAATGAPWWFIAGLHQMESTYNFAAHLHNGDPLTGRTIRVPAGRPAAGSPPFTWEESAADALARQQLTGLSDWSLPRALWRWERYNGFGYRGRGIATPYLWGFSSLYLRGKYVADGQFDGRATSAQCGAAVLLKALQAEGLVEIKTDMIAEREGQLTDAPGDGDAAAPPPEDLGAFESHPFAAFFAANLPGVRHFTWREFLFKGGAHAKNGLNADPPQELWPRIAPVVRALDELRARIGKPVHLLSVYRNAAYNAAVGGVGRSQHMAFRAADFHVVGAGRPADWAAALRALRDEGLFSGGVGLYDSFVHLDARGMNVDF